MRPVPLKYTPIPHLLVSVLLSAQERDSAATRPVVLDPIVVTGTATPRPLRQLGYAITLVSADDLEREHRSYAADVLRDVAGSFIDEAVGPTGPTIIRLRGGEETFTQILFDGVPINQNGGFFDFQGLRLTNVERVEISRGPQSSLYGTSAVAGVVQFLTRAGRVGSPSIEATVEGSGASNEGGGYGIEVAVRGGTNRLQYSLAGGLGFTRGFLAAPHDLKSRDGALRLDYSVSPAISVTAITRLINYESLLPVRDPGATRVPLDPNARNERTRSINSITASFAPTPNWKHRIRVSHYFEDFVFEDREDGVNVPELPFFVFDFNLDFASRLNRTAVEYLGTNTFAPGGAFDGLMLNYGLQLQRESLEDELGGDFSGATSFDRNSGALFTEGVAALGRFSVAASARAEKFDELDIEITPRLATRFTVIPERLHIRGALGRAYKAPNLQEQFQDNPFIASNPDLEPETSWSYELGIVLIDAAGNRTVAATVFRQEYDNLIRTVPLEGTNQGINRNLGESRADGVEVEGQRRISSRFYVGVSAAWTRTTILENSGLSVAEFPLDEELPFRPQWQGVVRLGVQPIDGLDLTGRLRFVDSQVVLSERFSGTREEVSGYALLDFASRLRVSPNLDLFLHAENLLDADYETGFDKPGAPITFTAGLRVRN